MRYLVTGAGGSIGSEIVRQLTATNPECVVLLGHSETAIYAINQECPRSIPVIADVRDLARMRAVMLEHRPDVVFHTAAVKHVPYAEAHPVEAVQTNVVGTRNVAIAAGMVGARLVFISTDKAVYPCSVMGKTKRIAELYVATCDNAVVVRFGNVLESSGSVIPLFRAQIAKGGPVTITHPEVSRYFMPIQQAAALALKAMTAEVPLLIPEVLVKRKILDIAKEMIGDAAIPITFTGLRPGEKLDEELYYRDQCTIPVRNADEMNRLVTSLERGDLSILDSFQYE